MGQTEKNQGDSVNGELGVMIASSGKRLGSLALMLFGMVLFPGYAQTVAKPPVKTPASGGNSFGGPNEIRYEAGRDPQDRRIDRFIGDWHDSMPRHEHGSLVLRDILTHGDNLTPPQPGAVLQAANFVAYGRLQPRDVTTSEKLSGQQEIYYIDGGTGEITAGGKTGTLHKDVAVFVPEGLDFVMKNTGNDDLTMYVVNEPVPAGFTPRKDMLVTDESTVPSRTPMEASPYTLPGASGHWAHIVRDLFSRADGLATVGDIITVTLNPMTMGEPHPHNLNQEEIWVAMDGTSLAFIGTQLRLQPPGMGYMIRPDMTMTHSNINSGDTPVKFLWFAGSSAQK
jgi:mannose-6-phosphate isomerase-like protein (cupin superfamily)